MSLLSSVLFASYAIFQKDKILKQFEKNNFDSNSSVQLSNCPSTLDVLYFSVLSCLICLVFHLRSQIGSACDSGHSGHLGHMDISHHFSTIQIYGMNGIMAALFHRSPRICPVPKSVPH
ncbi:MAG: hypothetical protein EZS28_040071 [Streblomastix strix]|uniref:Uncharacterized protein n=1 Tax=Streblomastix strix TaxID=222440 RepID=A0A5J4U380_9EUKA|nr:MAG: hypothetical protein EZS28_040071 [Streblomastix strix]